MDLHTAVYNAAHDGKLPLLQKLLAGRGREELEELLGEVAGGGTPLLIAARRGHLDVVEYLVDHCGASVEASGSVHFDGETIEGAPPLWAASAAGHLAVVRSLLRRGASVNRTTRTNSTPLRAACFDGHLDVVRYLVGEHKADLEVANRHGHTCLMISCYKGHREIARYLLERGAQVNRRSAKGNTALHDCAESGSLEILQLLLGCHARMERDGYGMTPLLAASVTGHTNIVEYLIQEQPGHEQLSGTELPGEGSSQVAGNHCSTPEEAEPYESCCPTSREAAVEALELLGATYVDKKRDLLGALKHWRRAMELRHQGGGYLPKPEPQQLVLAYDYSREVTTPQELEALITDPDEMRMQALLIRERILGPSHPDTSYYIRYRGAVYADSGNFERCIRLWKYALDMQQNNLEPLSPMTASAAAMEGSSYRVVFEKGGVYLHTSARKHQDPDSLIAGVIRVVEKDSDVFLHWAPVEEAGDPTQILFKKDPSRGEPSTSEEEPTFDPGYEPDWAVISTVRPQPHLAEPRKGAEPSSSRSSWAFSVSLGELKSIRRSKPGLSWAYLVLVTQAGGSLPALHFHRGGTRALLRVLSRYLLLASSPQDSRLYLVFPQDPSALSDSFHHLQLFDQDSSNVVSRFLQDPYSTTFSSFSRVTNFFRGALQPHPEGASSPNLPPLPDDEPEPGFEVISCVELGQRPTVERAPPVTEEEWNRYVGPEGRLQNVPELKNRIFSGGLSPGLRREAWKFLLGYLSWESSAEEHKAHVRKKTDEYFRMKLQWKSVSAEQERRNSLLHGYRSLIERDVSRTDRTNKFYEGPENPGLSLLHDILLTYCMYHFDLGYVQGMSDLLSPILFVVQNEVDAFWCFCGFMELVHGNFEESQETMKRQLGQLLLLLRVLDQPLCDFLDSQDSGSLCFCFRWLLIWFKREFPFPDVLRLWEVLWTGLPGPNLHLLVACAILDMERDTLMLSGFGSNEILKHINELTMKLSVEDVLTRAEALYRQLTACPELPHNVQEILGLAQPEEPSSPSPPVSPMPLSPTRAPLPPPLPEEVIPQPDSSLEILPEDEDGA